MEAEIKESVMEILKEELKNLKSAVERESGKKGKKGRKKSAKGKKKGKKGKDKKAKGAKGGKKGKKEKDLTSNRTMESLIEELVQTGLLQKVYILIYKNVMKPLNITSFYRFPRSQLTISKEHSIYLLFQAPRRQS